MLKSKFYGSIVSILVLSYFGGCSSSSVNIPELISTSGENLTINLKNLDTSEIEQVSLNGKALSNQDYNARNSQLRIKTIDSGKHVLQIRHKKYGEINIPLEIKDSTPHNYQVNTTLNQESLTDWEVGIDADKDGFIDSDSFISKTVEDFLVIRESSGKTNFLPREGFEDDFRKDKFYPRPDKLKGFEGFLLPPRPEKRLSEEKDLFQKPLKPRHLDPSLEGKPLSFPLPPESVNLKLENVLINGNKIEKTDFKVIENHVVIENLNYDLRGSKIALELIDETGQGILFNLDPRKPLVPPPDRAPMFDKKNLIIGQGDLAYSKDRNNSGSEYYETSADNQNVIKINEQGEIIDFIEKN